MLFMVEMTVSLSEDLNPEELDQLLEREKLYSQKLQREGVWRHVWRVTGGYANVSIFDVDSPDQLHAILTGLPLWPYIDARVTSLCNHPSAVRNISDEATKP